MSIFAKKIVLFLTVCALLAPWHDAVGQPADATRAIRAIEIKAADDQLAPPVVTAVALQPHGELLAVAGDDHLVRILDLATGRELRQLDGHDDWVRTVCFSPDGRVLASAGNDRRILLWDPATGRQLGVLAEHEHAITSITYSGDGHMLAAAGFQADVRLYDPATGRLIKRLNSSCDDNRSVSFSSDSRLLAAGGRNGRVYVWRTGDGRLIRDMAVHRQRIRSLVFSADGTQVISAGEDRTIAVSSIAAGTREFTISTRPSKILSLICVAPHRVAAAGSDNEIRLWDWTTGQQVAWFSGHTGSVATLAYRGGTLISGGYDTTVRVWKLDENADAGRSTRLETDPTR